MPNIKLEWKAHSHIRDEAVKLAAPLLEMTALLGFMARMRIQRRGRDADNHAFHPYSKAAKRARRKLGLQVAYKDFTRTGRFWGSMRAKLQSPKKAAVVFTGKAAHGTKKKRVKSAKGARGVDVAERVKFSAVTNADLARILNAKERYSMMQPSAVEAGEAMADFGDRLTAEIITAQSLETHSFMLARRARSAQRKAQKALRALKG